MENFLQYWSTFSPWHEHVIANVSLFVTQQTQSSRSIAARQLYLLRYYSDKENLILELQY